MIRALGFVDTSAFTAMLVVKYRDRAEQGILPLRSVKEGEADPSDLPILKEWKGARALLTRMRAAAAPLMDGVTPELGKVWVETLPPMSGTPWALEDDDYAAGHVRTRTCLIPAPDAWSICGGSSAILGVGVVNVLDLRLLASEVNHSQHARTHLIVDFKRPVDDGA